MKTRANVQKESQGHVNVMQIKENRILLVIMVHPIKPPPPADKLTDSEKKKIKQDNKHKANPDQAARNKEESDRKREKRKESGSTKTFS